MRQPEIRQHGCDLEAEGVGREEVVCCVVRCANEPARLMFGEGLPLNISQALALGDELVRLGGELRRSALMAEADLYGGAELMPEIRFKTMKELREQKLEAVFGQYIQFSAAVDHSDETVEMVTRMLAECIVRSAHLSGYCVERHAPWLRYTESSLADPFGQYPTLAAKMKADLKATPELFAMRTETWARDVLGTMEELSSFSGFARVRWRRLKMWVRNLFAEPYEEVECL